ncbi:protein racg [Anaeramoeba flamelloides]|uniref:Protein racg n=1 Tax=Anaeramoeba flamelloides TaxID=1746091 RepID=A0AAV7YKD5_9EUKA|nr:protein racg [Anaeramoeba flamelloides]
MKTINCTFVGDGNVGKTCMLMCFTTNSFPGEYRPTVFDNYSTTVWLNEEPINLQLRDTAGQEDYDRLRPLNYPGTDVVCVCFSLVLPNSFKNVTEKWVPEITNYCPDVPIVLVGTKLDLRDDKEAFLQMKNNDLKPISHQKGSELAEKLGAKYIECSSKSQKNLSNVFYESINTFNKSKIKKKKQNKNKKVKKGSKIKGCVIN